MTRQAVDTINLGRSAGDSASNPARKGNSHPGRPASRGHHVSDPFAKGGDRHGFWWADASYIRPGLFFRHRRVLRVSQWILRPRYSWNVRGYGRRWT